MAENTSSEGKENNYLYIAKGSDGEIRYVGIGGVTRPWGPHNELADEALRSMEVWNTSHPFSTRDDAEMAESLLVRALTWAQEKTPNLTNIAKVNSSKWIAPSLPYAKGMVSYSQFRNTLFVKITPGSLSGRSSPSGDTGNAELTMRCNRWWPLGSAVSKNLDVRYLVAVSAKTRPARIVGIWKTRPVSEWWQETINDPAPPPERPDQPWNGPHPPVDDNKRSGVTKWVVTVESPDPNPRLNLLNLQEGQSNQHQGKEFDWQGYTPQNVGWSQDLRSI